MREGEIDHENGILYVVDGAWGVGTRSLNPDNAWYLEKFEAKRHAIIVTLEGSRQDYRVVCEDGEIIDQFHLEIVASEK
jgi:hypothetical protein